MLIDRSHRPWALGTLVAFVGSSVGYGVYAARSTGGARGGTLVGLMFGIVGFALMIFAGLLSVRKKFPIWRIGRTRRWMRGHLWLGLLSFPLIVFHAGFTFGGLLTSVLMWVFVIVMVSGVVGAALQHVIPRMILERIPMETIYEQIPHVRQLLIEESDGIVATACGGLEVAASAAPDAPTGTSSLATIERIAADEAAPLREFYLGEMQPFLRGPDSALALADRHQSQLQFDRLRTILPAALHAVVADLENICEEERQLSRQVRMHRLLHGWLLIHLPLSFALLVLAVVHIVAALRY